MSAVTQLKTGRRRVESGVLDLTGRAPVVRGTLRWVVTLLVMVLIAQSIAVATLAVYGYRLYVPLAQKPPSVIEVGERGTVVHTPETFATSPMDIEILRDAWDIVRFTAGADSTNVRAYFKEAKRRMTAEMRESFEHEMEPTAKGIEDAQFTRELKVDPADIRFMTASDVRTPEEAATLDRYDVIVRGQMQNYSIGAANRPGAETRPLPGRFSYRVRLMPVPRTIEDAPTGLRVASILPWNPPPTKETSAKENSNESPQSTR